MNATSEPSPGSARTSAQTTYQLAASANLSAGLIAERLEHMTFPSLRARIHTQQLHEPLYGFAVTWGGEPVGLALAQGLKDRHVAEIVSLYVRRDHRGRCLSRPLLAGIERLLIRQGFRQIQLAYRSDWPARPIIEHRLRQLGWTPSVTNLMLGKFCVHDALAAWQASPLHQIQLPAGFQVISWADVTQLELDSLAQQTPADYPEELAPLEEPDRIEPLTSLLLRHRDRIIGWIVSHRLNAQTIQYTRLHVDPPYQRLGRGVSLIAAALRKQIEAGIPFGVFQVRTDNPRMQALVRRRFQPFLTTWTESRLSAKRLEPLTPGDSRCSSHPGSVPSERES